MSAGLTFAHILRRSIRHRGARSLSALLALTVSAAIATALLTLFTDLSRKLHHEFRSFGANIIVRALSTERGQATVLPEDAVARAHRAAGPDSLVVPFAYAIVTTDRGTPIVAAATDMDSLRRLNQWWNVKRWPQGDSEVLLGSRAATALGHVQNVRLHFNDSASSFHVLGEVQTGSQEDSRIYLSLRAFTAWTDLRPGVLQIQVPGGERAINAALQSLRQAFPTASVEPVRQLVAGESRIVDKTSALMLGSMLLIALTVAVSVLATLSASVLERRRDFALMKALGSSQRHMLGLFLGEALLLALLGVGCGWVIGSAIAWTISELNFDTASLPRLIVLPWVLLLNVAIALVAATGPSRLLRRLEPAALLKGD